MSVFTINVIKFDDLLSKDVEDNVFMRIVFLVESTNDTQS